MKAELLEWMFIALQIPLPIEPVLVNAVGNADSPGLVVLEIPVDLPTSRYKFGFKERVGDNALMTSNGRSLD